MAYRYRPGSQPTARKKKRRPAAAPPAMPPAPPPPALPTDDEVATQLHATAADLIQEASTLYDPALLTALIAAERKGKHRKTVIDAFKARLALLTRD
jgi:hypothetical protein